MRGKVFLWGSLVVFLGSLLLRQETAINQDLGRHLRLGEAIVTDSPAGARRAALTTNYLTYTYPEYPFINHHWGSEALFFVVYKLGGFSLLVLLKAIILGTAMVVTVIHASSVPEGSDLSFAALRTAERSDPRRQVTSLAISMGLVFLAVQMMATRLTTRPEIFSYLLFATLFWLLGRSPFGHPVRQSRTSEEGLSQRKNILIPALMVVWVNLHISFVFGFILVWLWAGVQILQRGLSLAYAKDNPRQMLEVIATAIAATMATLVNPAGIKGALMPVVILKDYGYTIVENMTPFFLRAFKPQPEYTIYVLLLTVTFILLFLADKKPSLFHLLVLVMFSIFPLIAVRHLPFFALVVPAVLVPLTSNFVKGQTLHKIVGGGLVVAALMNPVPLAYAKLPPVGGGVSERHFQAIDFVKRHQLKGKMWNNYDIGSFLEWAVPEHPTFVDGRPEAFPVGFLQEVYIPMQESKDVWDSYVREDEIEWVFAALTDATPWFSSWWQMIQKNQNWKIVYLDKATTILVRRDGTNGGIEPVGYAKTRELLRVVD